MRGKERPYLFHKQRVCNGDTELPNRKKYLVGEMMQTPVTKGSMMCIQTAVCPILVSFNFFLLSPPHYHLSKYHLITISLKEKWQVCHRCLISDEVRMLGQEEKKKKESPINTSVQFVHRLLKALWSLFILLVGCLFLFPFVNQVCDLLLNSSQSANLSKKRLQL